MDREHGGISNPDGTHSMLDLDNTWLEYMKSDRDERKEMCQTILDAEAVAYGIGFIGIVVFLIYALSHGWF